MEVLKFRMMSAQKKASIMIITTRIAPCCSRSKHAVKGTTMAM